MHYAALGICLNFDFSIPCRFFPSRMNQKKSRKHISIQIKVQLYLATITHLYTTIEIAWHLTYRPKWEQTRMQ